MKILEFFSKIHDYINIGLAFILKPLEPYPTLRFVVRELFHFLGGALIGLIPGLTKYVVFSVIAGVLMSGVIIAKEISEDNVSQPRYKTIIDVSAWIGGFLLPTLLLYLL